MASEIILSSAVRNNLLSLQKTAELLSSTQGKLATGLKVNSALDDPTAFFTASALNSRASDLNRLQDFVGNAVQTIKTADEGITSITDLVENAEAVARRALQEPATISQNVAKIDGSVTIADDAIANTLSTANITVDAAITTIAGDDAVSAAVTLTTAGFDAGDLITVTINQVETVFTVVNDGANTSNASDGIINVADSIFDLYTEIANLSTGITTTVTNAVSQTAGFTFTTDVEDFTLTFADDSVGTGTAAQVLATSVGLTIAEAGFADGTFTDYTNADLGALEGTVTFQIGDNTDTLTFGTGTDEINNRAELDAALTALATTSNTGGTFELTGSLLDVSATSIAEGAITVTVTSTSGDIAAALNIATQVDGNNDTIEALIAANSAADETLIVSDGTNSDTLTFGYDAGEISTKAELETAIRGALANSGARLDVDSDDNLIVVGGEGDTITLTGTNTNAAAVAFGLATTATVATEQEYDNAKREQEAVNYDALLVQIDALAGDTTFNGVNLLQSANLSVVFNESGSSSLSISGVDFDSGGLGIDIANDKFSSDTNINNALAQLDSAKSALQSQAAAFGSNLSVVEIRQDFTKALINVLETGAANLTLADTNQEGANLLALQTRSSLSSTALSLASQADQQVLRLF